MKKTLGEIVTWEVLNIKGQFTKEEVIKRLKKKKIRKDIKNMYFIYNDLERYIEKKIDVLSEYGLIGKTSFYYFSL